MSPADAKHAVKLINTASWPDGVSVRAELCGQGDWVSVCVTAPGVVPVRLTIKRPIGLFGWRNLRDAVDDVLAGSIENRTPFGVAAADEPDPEPSWLRETLTRVAVRTKGRPGLYRLACQLASCLECDDIPTPQVIDFRGLSIVFRWRHEGKVLEIAAGVDGEVKVAISNVYGGLFVASYRFVGTDFRERGLAFANIRSAVQSVLGREPVTRDLMELEVS